jgi:mycothiol synthase
MKNQLPSGYQFRPATLEDLEPTVRLLNEWSQKMLGSKAFEVTEFDTEWSMPGFDLEQDTRLVLTPQGEIVGYYEVWDVDDPHVHVNIWGRVHPAHSGCGIGSYLIEWAEERGRMAIPKAPKGARVAIIGHCLTIDAAARELFNSAGFNLIRYSLRMVIELDGPPPEPVWPEGVTMRTLVVGQDEPAALQAVRDSFKDHWGNVTRPFEAELARWKHFMETDEIFDPNLWNLAIAGDQVVGMALNYPYVDDDHEMGWVGTLGVVREWRRRGLGLALLQHSFQQFYQRGKRRVGLGVDAESLTGATRLYLKAGMHPDPAREWSIFEKELRPGRELSTQSI